MHISNPKKVCIVGKGPPLQGGTATHTFWAARSLALSGWEVHLVTNATEARSSYRHVMIEEDEEVFLNLLEQGVIIHYTTPVPVGSFIPFAHPYQSQLLGILTNLITTIRFDAMIGWYMEPYGIAASIAGRLAGIPTYIRHAGSDLGRLTNYPDLASAARFTLQEPVKILTSSIHKNRFIDLEVPVERQIQLGAARLPDYHINTKVASFEFDKYRLAFSDWIKDVIEDSSLRTSLSANNPCSNTGPRMCIYGKVGIHKGSFSLLRALNDSRFDTVPFQFYPVACGHVAGLQKYFRELASCLVLLGKTICLPPLPPWRIPALLRSMDIVFILENRFPIAFHSPVLIREVLASGACLVCSREIAEKAPYRHSLIHGRNIIIVEDPECTDELVSVICKLIESMEMVKSIGRHGKYLSTFIEQSYPARHPLVALLDSLS